MQGQLKKRKDYDGFHDEDESFIGRFKIVAIACGGALLAVALAMVGLFIIVLLLGAGGTR